MSADPSLWRSVFRLPSTPAGRWSGACLLGVLLFFGTMNALVLAGHRGGDTLFSDPWLAWTGLGSLAWVMAGGVLALVAIVSKRERSIVSFVALGLALLLSIFLLGEVVSPH